MQCGAGGSELGCDHGAQELLVSRGDCCCVEWLALGHLIHGLRWVRWGKLGGACIHTYIVDVAIIATEGRVEEVVVVVK